MDEEMDVLRDGWRRHLCLRSRLCPMVTLLHFEDLCEPNRSERVFKLFHGDLSTPYPLCLNGRIR